LLIVKEAADPLDEGLNLPFNWVLMLMAGGSWLHGHTVVQVFEKEETIVPADRNGADSTLIVNTQRFCGE
jgi:hypothetical protein